MGQVVLMTSSERRRKWSDAEKLRILDEAFSPGASVSEVCRRHAVSSGLIYTWRGKFRGLAGPSFAEAVVTPEPSPPLPTSGAAIVIELSCGRLSIASSAPPALVVALLKALR
jgi:transposase